MIKLLSLFSGIGAPEQALKNIGIDYELVGFSEIDKYAIKSYCSVHGVSETLNLGDITKIDIHSLPKDIDLITHGSPCQSFSIAGKQAGGDEGSGTRSSLMWNTVEIVEKVKPKYVLWENVKNVLSKKHKPNFDKYISRMEELGYKNFYQVLNAKNYGVPQNRERIFVISIRNDIEKDFKFPEPFDSGLRLKDILEKDVDERFYISKEKCEKLIKELKPNTSKDFLLGGEQKHQAVKYDGISTTLTSSMGTGGGYIPMINTTPVSSNDENIKEKIQPVITPDRLNLTNSTKRIGGIFDSGKSKHQAGSVWDKDYLSPTLDTMQEGWRQPCIIIETPCIAASRGRKPKNTSDRTPGIYTQRLEINKNGTSNTLTTVQKDNYVLVKEATEKQATSDEYRIRKLTPLECWRLMGFKDEQFNKAQSVCSNSQLYKQAGNSIVVDVLEKIFENIFKSEE